VGPSGELPAIPWLATTATLVPGPCVGRTTEAAADARAAGVRMSDAELVAAMTVTDEELLSVLAARAAV
jgi:hypothetical protein